VTDLTPNARQYALAELKRMRTGSIFTPPGVQASWCCRNYGGGEWGGGAFDPETRLFYVNASNEARMDFHDSVESATGITVTDFGA